VVVIPGTAALDDGAAVDFAELRRARHDRVLREMEADGVELLLLGREDLARFVTGARRLWTAGTRPFAPTCIVTAGGEVRLMSQYDDGVPPEIPFGHLFPLTWNPLNFLEAIGSIPGASTAARVAVDGMSPLFAQLLRAALPAARFVDALPLLRRAQRVKSPAELTCLRIACAVTEAGVAAAHRRLQPGARAVALVAGYRAATAHLGVTTVGVEGPFGVLTSAPPHLSDRLFTVGAPVAIGGGSAYAGYLGVVGGTWSCPPSGSVPAPIGGWRIVRDAVVAACRPGATGDDLQRAYLEAGGVLVAGIPAVSSVGVGFERILVGAERTGGRSSHEELEAGMTLALQVLVPGDPPSFGACTIHVTDGPAELLSVDPMPGAPA
jgi:Xaa-Pro dipeptidase